MFAMGSVIGFILIKSYDLRWKKSVENKWK